MPSTDRRTAALERTVERRTQLEETLRAKLASQREEHAMLEAQRDAKREAVRHESDLLQAYRDRIARMMCGDEAFSLADMNASMRYTEIVEQRLRECEKALAEAEQIVRAHEDEVAATIRAIAGNRGRIDLCKERIEDIGRMRANAANDAADEEAEEAVLARMRLAAGPTV
ncbi:MAG TPA: type III secretion protein SctO [Trinickia sp.]|uniref:type III secretion protein SctO n=1 Tax=Trinickia sp. TaxID=2571163 RepID=UPI002BDE8C1A|nr:type III secretion protein SctO [Trinickia sp.]HVW50637.1 type III secretion protein SctO [Trinickia sp.]